MTVNQTRHQLLVTDFYRRGIPTDTPGFFDHPAFVQAEREDSNYLDNYASYVATRFYSEDYLAKARTDVLEIARVVQQGLAEDGRSGACIDASNALSRMLDREGYWNYQVKGSLVIEFPPESGITTKFFWAVDVGEFTAGHSWLAAPPYRVLDITISQQPYTGAEREWLPALVASESASEVIASPEDVISPEIRRKLTQRGATEATMLSSIDPKFPRFFEQFPTVMVDATSMKLKYITVAITAGTEELEEISNITFGELSAAEIYRDRVLPRLARLRENKQT